MQEYAKHFARRMLLIYFLRSTYKKYIFLYPETGPRNRPKLKKKKNSLRGGELLIKNKHFA